jgi:hypothetical protein
MLVRDQRLPITLLQLDSAKALVVKVLVQGSVCIRSIVHVKLCVFEVVKIELT